MILKFCENLWWRLVNKRKIGPIERNQDFRGLPIYHEIPNYTKTYFSGYKMMLATINNKKLSFKSFCWLTHFTPKSAKFQNNSKNDSPSGTWAPPGGTIFLSKILILVSSISYFSMAKKGFLIGKIWFFKIVRLKISKILKFCSLRVIFSIFFRQ